MLNIVHSLSLGLVRLVYVIKITYLSLASSTVIDELRSNIFTIKAPLGLIKRRICLRKKIKQVNVELN